MIEGSLDSKILFISDFQRVHCRAENRVFSGYLGQCLENAISSAGLLSTDYTMTVIHPVMPPGGSDARRIDVFERQEHLAQFKELLKNSKANVLVPLGDYAMNIVTGLDSLDKWHCNVVEAKAEYGGRKTIPILHPSHIMKVFGDSFYLRFGVQRVQEQMEFPEIRTPFRKCIILSPFAESMEYLNSLLISKDPLAVDIETGQGFINTVGFAKSATEAIAIRTLAEFYTEEEFFQLWKKIAEILESGIPLILQNFIYESTWFARYGIHMRHVVHDTMWAMKFLHPELEKGLHNVGRIYTHFPYWKDDNDDWNNIKDWPRHLKYNCYDTCGTYEGWKNQSIALHERGLDKLFNGFVMKFAPVIHEMCTEGLLVDPNALVSLQEKLMREKDNYMRIIDSECTAKAGGPINPRSSQQLKQALKTMGMKIPTQKGKESTDKKALVKLRRKYPDEQILSALIGLSATNKRISSYTDFEYDRTTSRVHYSLDGCGTETGRFCLRFGQLISLSGEEKRIEDVRVGDFVYCYDNQRNLQLRKVLWAGKTGHKKVVRLHWKSQSGRTGHLDVTPEHRIRMLDGSYKRACDIRPKERTLALHRSVSEGYVELNGLGYSISEHRFIYMHRHGISPEVVHHIDHNKLNNRIDNLCAMSRSEHIKLHAESDARKPSRQPNYTERARGSSVGNAKLDELQVLKIKELLVAKTNQLAIADAFDVSLGCIKSIAAGRNWKHVQLNNHIIESVEDLNIYDDVYDLEVDDCHNFIANEICVHNSGYKSGWGEGFNPQTVPKPVRNCFQASSGRVLLQIDLAQAESRYVAWESPEPTLMQMLAEGRDVHKYVASKIFKKPEEFVNKQERQLGKKSGHSANYDVGPRTFAEACLVEMNLYLEEHEARRILDTYNEVFPGIRKRKMRIQSQLWASRMLKTPIGRERYFYGRMDEGTFREAYAYAPQSVIPDITNHLMLKLYADRDYLGIDKFLLQVHDSLLLEVEPERVPDIAAYAHDLKAWHPKIQLAGGELWIPVEVEVGSRWGNMEVI